MDAPVMLPERNNLRLALVQGGSAPCRVRKWDWPEVPVPIFRSPATDDPKTSIRPLVSERQEQI